MFHHSRAQKQISPAVLGAGEWHFQKQPGQNGLQMKNYPQGKPHLAENWCQVNSWVQVLLAFVWQTSDVAWVWASILPPKSLKWKALIIHYVPGVLKFDFLIKHTQKA